MAKLKDLLDIDLDSIMRMSADEARQLAREFGYKANARYTRLKKAGTSTPATEGFERAGGRITTRGATRNELIADIFQARSFLTAQTSTEVGYRKFKQSAQQRISKSAMEMGYDLEKEELSDAQMRKLWKAYRKISEIPGTSAFTSNQIQGMLYDQIKSAPDKRRITPDNLVDSAIENLNEYYSEREALYDDYYSRIFGENE